MAFTKLNHTKLYEFMARTGTRPCDLARSLGLSRQVINYILHNGGRKYITKLAKYFDCEEHELAIPKAIVPKGFQTVNDKVRKVNPR